MQNPIQKFRQSSIVFGILSENLKTLTSSNYSTVQYFCWNVAHVSCLVKSADLELFKNLKIPSFLHSFFTFLLITQDLNKIKKIPHIFVDFSK